MGNIALDVDMLGLRPERIDVAGRPDSHEGLRVLEPRQRFDGGSEGGVDVEHRPEREVHDSGRVPGDRGHRGTPFVPCVRRERHRIE